MSALSRPPKLSSPPSPAATQVLRGLGQCAWRAAVTMVELLIAVAILSLVAGTAIWGLSTSNHLATANRYLLAAKVVGQARIDDAQTVTYTTTGAVPAVLTTGTTTTNVTVANTTPPLAGTMSTAVAVTDATLGLRRVTVTVNYTYRGRPYNVRLATARAPD